MGFAPIKNRLKFHFTRHDLWALRTAIRLPLTAVCLPLMIAFFWVFLPVSMLVFLGAVTGGSLGLAADKIILPMIAVLLCVTLVGVIRAIGWFFEWYFIAAGLMLGRTGMAKQKLKKLRQQLTRLDLDYLTSQSVKQ
ncbi:hypothetical protein [Pararhizobium sp. DWP1-1-3]|uniref:hypothetical protein n=1 Tax=Pararhizobium sp. DWP1-1-3 TaxID=2804652 RepID=UPI003CF4E59E